MKLFEVNEFTKKNDHAKYATDFQTPYNVCKYMVSLIPENCRSILEPTPGIGNIVNALEECGYDRFAITAPKDFFLLKANKFDAVIMNPPFSSKYAFMENAPAGINKHGMRLGYHILTECMQMSDNVIALMPNFTISDSDVKLRFLKSYGLISLTALPRITFKYARIQTLVLQLQKGYAGTTEFKVFDLLK